MLDLKTKLAAATASIAFTVGLVALAAPAAASQIEGQSLQLTVQTADLNLDVPAGRVAAERRIRAAAHLVCAAEGTPVGAQTACRARAMAEAIAMLDRRMVVAASETR